MPVPVSGTRVLVIGTRQAEACVYTSSNTIVLVYCVPVCMNVCVCSIWSRLLRERAAQPHGAVREAGHSGGGLRPLHPPRASTSPGGGNTSTGEGRILSTIEGTTSPPINSIG
jgi:hypothetical protein